MSDSSSSSKSRLRSSRRAIALRPRYWASYSRAGEFYFSAGRYDDAQRMFEQVIEYAHSKFQEQISLDTETTNIWPTWAEIVGYSFAWNEGQAW